MTNDIEKNYNSAPKKQTEHTIRMTIYVSTRVVKFLAAALGILLPLKTSGSYGLYSGHAYATMDITG